jgi:adenylosuccinate synthase
MFDSKTRTVVVVGAQWGDEGKGKLVDVLAEQADWVVRYQGGANAGHTVHIGDKSFILHQIPSGILHPGVRCAIGNGVVMDPETLFTEIDELVADGVDVEGRLYVSERAHLVMPYQGDRHDGAWHRPRLRRQGGPSRCPGARPAQCGPSA